VGAERSPMVRSDKKKGPVTRTFSGAGDRTRTGDPHLGKVMLYQLSHARRALSLSDRAPIPRAYDVNVKVFRASANWDLSAFSVPGALIQMM
jgi:hypothetical protein